MPATDSTRVLGGRTQEQSRHTYYKRLATWTAHGKPAAAVLARRVIPGDHCFYTGKAATGGVGQKIPFLSALC
jgi:hypothetical protein